MDINSEPFKSMIEKLEIKPEEINQEMLKSIYEKVSNLNIKRINKKAVASVIYLYLNYGIPVRYLSSLAGVDYAKILLILRDFDFDLEQINNKLIDYLLRNEPNEVREKFNKLKDVALEDATVPSYRLIALYNLVKKKAYGSGYRIRGNLLGMSELTYRKHKNDILKNMGDRYGFRPNETI